jgi:hypothetical protein
MCYLHKPSLIKYKFKDYIHNDEIIEELIEKDDTSLLHVFKVTIALIIFYSILFMIIDNINKVLF